MPREGPEADGHRRAPISRALADDRGVKRIYPSVIKGTHPKRRSEVVHLLKPRIDLHEDAEKNLVTATFELPGLTKDQVNINMHAGNLIISGEVSESTEKSEHGYAVRERRTGRFSRSVGLPEGTKVSAVASSMENGVLTATYPKATAVQEPQRIVI
ncbi:HSP20-like chaperone, partial [Thelephora terrestris]